MWLLTKKNSNTKGGGFLPAPESYMRIIIFVFSIIVIFTGLQGYNQINDALGFRKQTMELKKQTELFNAQGAGVGSYQDGLSTPLDIFYTDIFNKVKAVSRYYAGRGEVKILNSKDLVDIASFAYEAQYPGIKYMDILSRISLEKPYDTTIFEYIYDMYKNNPIEILEIKKEDKLIDITIRLYGI